MNFDLNKSIEILERTPLVIEALLSNVSDEWTMHNEGGESWSAYDVVGHLIHGEKTDWVQRLEIILSDEGTKKFQPFDRFAQFTESKGKNLQQLIQEFKTVRTENLSVLKSKQLQVVDFDKTGIHPVFGEVSLRNLLSTWAVHDLSHLAQINRVMAKQYSSEVGPWKEFLPILTPHHSVKK